MEKVKKMRKLYLFLADRLNPEKRNEEMANDLGHNMYYVQKWLKILDHFPQLNQNFGRIGKILNWGKFGSGAPHLPEIDENIDIQFGAVDFAPIWNWGKIEVGAQQRL